MKGGWYLYLINSNTEKQMFWIKVESFNSFANIWSVGDKYVQGGRWEGGGSYFDQLWSDSG